MGQSELKVLNPHFITKFTLLLFEYSIKKDETLLIIHNIDLYTI